MTQDHPYIVEVEGTQAFCTCGKSGDMPFCDGGHKELRAQGIDAGPCVETFDAPRKVAICGCGRSGNSPYCDGSHSQG